MSAYDPGVLLDEAEELLGQVVQAEEVWRVCLLYSDDRRYQEGPFLSHERALAAAATIEAETAKSQARFQRLWDEHFPGESPDIPRLIRLTIERAPVRWQTIETRWVE